MPQSAVNYPLTIKFIEDQTDDLLNLLVWVEGHLSGKRLEISNRHSDLQVAATSLVQPPLIPILIENI